MKRVAAQRISTLRLTLVPLAPAHADELALALADPQLHEFVGGEPLGTETLRAQVVRWAAGPPDASQSWLNWAIQVNESGAIVGTMQATVYDADPGPTADIAWVVGTTWQGHGFAREATRGLVTWLLDLGVAPVSALIHPEHAASQRVATAAGLQPTEHVADGEIRWIRRT